MAAAQKSVPFLFLLKAFCHLNNPGKHNYFKLETLVLDNTRFLGGGKEKRLARCREGEIAEEPLLYSPLPRLLTKKTPRLVLSFFAPFLTVILAMYISLWLLKMDASCQFQRCPSYRWITLVDNMENAYYKDKYYGKEKHCCTCSHIKKKLRTSFIRASFSSSSRKKVRYW